MKTYYQIADIDNPISVWCEADTKEAVIAEAEDMISQVLADDDEEGSREKDVLLIVVNADTGEELSEKVITISGSYESFDARKEWGTY